MSETPPPVRRITFRLALSPVPRRWLLLLAMLAALPLSGQNVNQVQVVFPPPIGRHTQLFTTGTGTQTVSAFSRLGGTTNIGTTSPSPGASFAVTGNTVIGGAIDPALSAYAMSVTGAGAGVQMESRGGVAGSPSWAMYASSNKLNMWYSGIPAAPVLSFDQNGAIPMCIKGPGYHFPAVTACPVDHPFAAIAVNAANSRIPVLGDPHNPNTGANLSQNIGTAPAAAANSWIICCKFN